jgi:hypothetical protein
MKNQQKIHQKFPSKEPPQNLYTHNGNNNTPKLNVENYNTFYLYLKQKCAYKTLKIKCPSNWK